MRHGFRVPLLLLACLLLAGCHSVERRAARLRPRELADPQSVALRGVAAVASAAGLQHVEESNALALYRTSPRSKIGLSVWLDRDEGHLFLHATHYAEDSDHERALPALWAKLVAKLEPDFMVLELVPR